MGRGREGGREGRGRKAKSSKRRRRRKKWSKLKGKGVEAGV